MDFHFTSYEWEQWPSTIAYSVRPIIPDQMSFRNVIQVSCPWGIPTSRVRVHGPKSILTLFSSGRSFNIVDNRRNEWLGKIYILLDMRYNKGKNYKLSLYIISLERKQEKQSFLWSPELFFIPLRTWNGINEDMANSIVRLVVVCDIDIMPHIDSENNIAL